MYRKLLILSVLFLFMCLKSYSQIFEGVNTTIPGLSNEEISCGDYNNDGYMDILVTGYLTGGSDTTILFRNNGNGTFTKISAGFYGLQSSSSEWGDYDNDGDLDIVLTGAKYSYGIPNRKSFIYRNNGNGTFTDINAGLIQVYSGSVDWGDYDNDGDLDLLLTGATDQGDPEYKPVTRIYTNNGNGTFTDINAGLTGVALGSASWGDYDNDGDLDILLTGISEIYGSTDNGSILYRNDGNNKFIQIKAGLMGVSNSSGEWGDYDNDGDLDIFIAGSLKAKIYRNDGNDVFTDINASLEQVSYCSSVWVDYDMDGDLDILLAGYNGSTCITKLYKNNGQGNFYETYFVNLTGIKYADLAVIDYNNDSKTDILLTGRDISNLPVTKLYKNKLSAENSNPSSPANLRFNPDKLIFTWDASTDNESLQNSLQYNIRIGTTPGGNEIVSSMSLANGRRMFIQQGNTGFRTSYSIPLKTSKTYYWSVQSFDNQLGASSWATEKTVDISSFPTVNIITSSSDTTFDKNIPVSITFSQPVADFNEGDITVENGIVQSVSSVSTGTKWNAIINPDAGGLIRIKIEKGKVHNSAGSGNIESNTVSTFYSFLKDTKMSISGLSDGSAIWGDYNSDGYLDILVTGSGITKIYRNNGDRTFTDINVSLPALSGSEAKWGDYDNDGDLDILLSGAYTTKVYRNNGNGSFTDAAAGLKGLSYSSADWGDFNKDGYSDILIAGTDGNNTLSIIYRNNGNGTFSDIRADLAGVTNGSAEWADFDNDGFLDFLLTGSDLSKIYHNNGNEIFTEITTAISAINNGSGVCGDYDNDGDLDVLLVGGESFMTTEYGNAILYRNNGDGSFTDIKAGFIPVAYGNGLWGDYDNDGDLDILITGQYDLKRITRLYRNEGNGFFTCLNTILKDVNFSSLSWGDYDNDGDLDLLLTGRDNSNLQVSKLYQNNISVSNSLPDAVTNLHFDPVNFNFGWDASKDNETPVKALSYNIRIGTAPGDRDIISPMSLTSGKRLIADYGNTGQNPRYTQNIKSATRYYWSVQAIDNQLAGSIWSAEQIIDLTDYTGVSITTAKDTTDVINFSVTITFSNTVTGFNTNNIQVKNGKVVSLQTITTGLVWKAVIQGNEKLVTISIPGNSVMNIKGKTNLPSNLCKVVIREFTSISSALPGFSYCTVAWGDYDNDKDLDILIAGSESYMSKIYRNNGNGSFTDMNASIAGVRYGSAAWGDYDNDGDLDVLLTGLTNTAAITKIYRNDGNGIFTDLNAALQAVSWGSGSWGDYDNDKKLDILLTGDNYSIIYHNNGDNTFTNINAGLTGIRTSTGTWCDYNNDGYSDVIIAGGIGSGPNYPRITRLYRNNRNGTFSGINAGLENISAGSLDWGDFDNDGDQDLLLTGENGSGEKTSKVYRNDGDGAFSDINAGLTGVYFSSAIWGDYDSDGDLDIFLSGYNGNSGISKIYRNNGNGVFTDIFVLIEGIQQSSAKWGDFDNDGDQDIILAGNSASGQVLKIFRNNLFTATSAVNFTSFNSYMQKYDAILEWRTDNTIQNCTFNVRAGVLPNGEEILKSGTVNNIIRQIPAMGNAQSSHKFRINLKDIIDHVPSNSIYWNVQVIGNNFIPYSWSGTQVLPINIIADFIANTVCEEQSTSFTDLSFGSFFDKWIWDYGDGKKDTIINQELKNTKHIYPKEGVYNATLTVFSGSSSNSISKAVMIYNKPAADFSVEPVCEGDNAYLKNSSVTDNMTISGWLWDFGDGSSAVTQGSIYHKYAQSDTAKLVIISDKGCSDSIQKPVLVAKNPLAVISSNTPLSFCNGDSVILTVSNNMSYSYNWKLNDLSLTGGNTNKYTARISGTYSVEVINPVANCKTISSPAEITVLDIPVKPFISYNKPVPFCDGDSAVLSVTNIAGYNYQWKVNGGAVGINSSQYVAKTSGLYNLVVSNSLKCPSASSNSITVTVNPRPIVGALALEGKKKFCSGEVAILSLPSTTGFTYTWKNSEGIIGGASLNSYSVRNSGTYTLEVSSVDGCKVNTDPVTLEVVQQPLRPTINHGGYSKGMCLGENPLKLSIEQVVPGYNYKWYKNGTSFSNSTFIEITDEAKYYLEAYKDVCTSPQDSIEIVFMQTLPIPDIIAKGPTVWYLMSATDAKYYKWYYNGTIISGAVNNTYLVGQKPGLYRLAVSDDNQCFSFSNTIRIPTDITGIKDADPFKDLKIFPNPATGLITIEMKNNLFGELSVDIYTQNGSKVLNINFEKTMEYFSRQIDLSGQQQGVYLLTLKIEGNASTIKLILE